MIITSSLNKVLFLLFFLVTIVSCKEVKKTPKQVELTQEQNEQQFINALEKHLDAVEKKDLKALKATMSPKGNMELIQPNMEVIKRVDGFMRFHEVFFNHPEWSLKFKIISKNVGNKIGIATTEAMYREPERNGKPYFSRMTVTYSLEKNEGKWYVIKDHASFIEKTE